MSLYNCATSNTASASGYLTSQKGCRQVGMVASRAVEMNRKKYEIASVCGRTK